MSCPATDNSVYGPPPPVYFNVLGIDIFVVGAIVVFFVALSVTAVVVRIHVKKMRARSQYS